MDQSGIAGADDVPASLTPAQLLKALDERAWQPALRRLRRNAQLQFWIKLTFILGGAVIGAVGGAMEGRLIHSGDDGTFITIKGALVAMGALSVFFGGIVSLVVEDDSPELLNSARALSSQAQEHLAALDALRLEYDMVVRNAEVVDRKRRERLLAIERMCETVEAALQSQADTARAAERMLSSAIHPIHKAVDYGGQDFFTVTIFRKEDHGDGERMHAIARQWTDSVKGELDKRSWALGKGYTGVVWQRAQTNPRAAVVIEDTSPAHLRNEYPVDHYDPAIEALYLSVAAFPILIGKGDDVWGVVTATFDRPHVFKHDVSALGPQNVEVIRDVGRFAGLLAGLDLALEQTTQSAAQGKRPKTGRNSSFIHRLLPPKD